MTDWKLPWNGGCRCDRVRFTITAPPLLTMACHCSGCQRMSASAYSLSMAIPTPGFTITQGEPEIGGLHGKTQHFHCPYCKTWMFTRPAGMEDQFVNVRPTMLDEHLWFVPFAETCTSEGYAWAKTGAVHSYPDIPGMEVYGPLIAEFAQRGAHP
jgi:hypothetical protein